jgi:hypothetical protein
MGEGGGMTGKIRMPHLETVDKSDNENTPKADLFRVGSTGSGRANGEGEGG